MGKYCEELKGDVLVTENECKTAANELEVTYAGIKNNARAPKGCNWWDAQKKIWLNTDPANNRNSLVSPVCQKGDYET